MRSIVAKPLAPPFTEQELRTLPWKQRTVLARRYGLVDGICRTFEEVGEACGFGGSRAAALHRQAIGAITRHRDPAGAFEAGQKMSEAARMPAALRPRGRGRGRRHGGRRRISTWVGEALHASSFEVFGEDWHLSHRDDCRWPHHRSWTVFVDAPPRRRVLAVSATSKVIRGPVCLMEVSSSTTRWRDALDLLQELVIDHQHYQQSLAFLGSPDVSVGHVTVTRPGSGGHSPPSFSIAREISA
jgi:hypothetical protein